MTLAERQMSWLLLALLAAVCWINAVLFQLTYPDRSAPLHLWLSAPVVTAVLYVSKRHTPWLEGGRR